jgi:PASTA domain
MPDRWVNPHGWGPPPPGSGPPAQGPPPPPQGPNWESAGPPEGWEPPTQQQPPAWGPPPPAPSSSGRPWWRRWYVVLAAALVVLGVVALNDQDDPSTTAIRATTPPTTNSPLPTVATTTTLPTTSTAAPTTIAMVKVPRLVGMKLSSAKAALADRGLRGRIRYRTTSRYPAGTVIAQSHRTGVGVLPDSRVTLVVAKAPPPTTAPPPPSTAPAENCDPSYPDVCLDPSAEDYDCAGGSGNGPEYVEGPIRVRPPDPFGLDADGDGLGCEDG